MQNQVIQRARVSKVKEKATKKQDTGPSKSSSKGGHKDKKAELKIHDAKAVEGKDYAGASKFYNEAIKVDPADAALYSNRSLCLLKSGEAHAALLDANPCIRLRPDWPKGYYRKGAAFMVLKEYKEACDAFMAGVKLDPASVEMHEAFWKAVEAMKEHCDEQVSTHLVRACSSSLWVQLCLAALPYTSACRRLMKWWPLVK